MSGRIGRSTASAGEQNVNDVDEQSQGPGCISRSTASVSVSRYWTSVRDRQVCRQFLLRSEASDPRAQTILLNVF